MKIEGEADAGAARIYASAYSAPDAQDLYLFLRTLDVARSAFEKDTTAVISTNSDLGRMLKSMGGSGLKGMGSQSALPRGLTGLSFPEAHALREIQCASSALEILN